MSLIFFYRVSYLYPSEEGELMFVLKEHHENEGFHDYEFVIKFKVDKFNEWFEREIGPLGTGARRELRTSRIYMSEEAVALLMLRVTQVFSPSIDASVS